MAADALSKNILRGHAELRQKSITINLFKMTNKNQQNFWVLVSSWVTENIRQFSPWSNGELSDLGLKAFCELAIAVQYVKDVSEEHPSSFADDVNKKLIIWLDHLTAIVSEKWYVDLIYRRPWAGYNLILPYLILRTSGFKIRRLDGAFDYLEKSGCLSALERVPFRLLDMEFFTWKSGLRSNEPLWQCLYNSCSISREVPILYADRLASYAITHAIFYLTDFGKKKPQFLFVDKLKIAKTLKALLVHYSRVGDLDLVGEILLSLVFIDEQDWPMYKIVSQDFDNMVQVSGFIPPNRPKSFESIDLNSSFSRVYHTSLVGMLYYSQTIVHEKVNH